MNSPLGVPRQPIELGLRRLAGDPSESATAETSFLAGCTDRDWERILRHCIRRRFRAEEVIVGAGSVDRALLFVTSGTLELRVEDSGGRQQLFERVDAPAVLGEVAFFDGGPRSATLVAATDGEMLRLEFSAFQTLSATSPALARMILMEIGRVIALRLRRTTRVAAR